jgi:vitamin B12 transporter
MRFDELIGHHSGSSYTYDEQELREFQDTQVSDFLQRSSSFYVSQQGAPGSSSSVFLRGQEASSLAVYIDGVLVNDPTNPSRSYDFGHLSLSQVSKIQVFQGPQTVLHGASALGGVISITTLASQSKDQGQLSYQLERYQSHDASLSYSAKNAGLNWGIGVNHKNSKGFSSANTSAQGAPTPDGREFDQLQLSLQTQEWSWKARYQHDQYDLDGFDSQTSLPTDAPYDTGLDEQWQISSNRQKQLSPTLWSNYLFSFKNSKRRTQQDGKISSFEGISWQLKLNHQWQQSSKLSAVFGIQGFLEKAVRPLDNSRRSGGLYWLQHYENGSFLASMGARVESHQSSKEDQALSFSLAKKITAQQTLKYNYSTAYRTPSLSELFDPLYGNVGLEPENSQHHELSWLYNPSPTGLKLQTSLFTTRTHSRISFDNQSLKSVNKGSSAIYGLEVRAGGHILRPDTQVQIEGTVLKAYDLESGNDLLRRPRQKWGLSLSQKLIEQLSMNANLLWVSKRKEFNSLTLPSYTQLDLLLKYRKQNEDQEFWAGVKNLLDEPNSGAAGYTSPGVVWSLGLSKNF